MDLTKSPELNHTTLIREASHLASFASTAEIEKLPFAVLRKMEAVLVTILNLVNFEEAARASSLVLLPLSTSVTSAQSPQAQHRKVAESVKDLLRSLHVLEKFGERHFRSLGSEVLTRATAKVGECSSLLIGGLLSAHSGVALTPDDLAENTLEAETECHSRLPELRRDSLQKIRVVELVSEFEKANSSDDRRVELMEELANRLGGNFAHEKAQHVVLDLLVKVRDSQLYSERVRECAARILELTDI